MEEWPLAGGKKPTRPLFSPTFPAGLPGGTSGKEPACQCRKHKGYGFDPWIGTIPWRRAWQRTPGFLPGEAHGQRSLAGHSPWGLKESDAAEWLSMHRPSCPASCSGNSAFSLHPVSVLSFSCPVVSGALRCHGLLPRRASLSLTTSGSLPNFTFIASVMPSIHLILWCPRLLLPSIFPSIRDFSNESSVHIRWPKYWSFSISPSSEYLGLISLKIDWVDLAVQGTLKSLLQDHSSKAPILCHSSFFTVQLSPLYVTTGKTITLTIKDFCQQSNVSVFQHAV